MSANRTGTMPAPHEHIAITVSHWFGEKWNVIYTARPAELVAAGLVTPYMEEKILHQRSGYQLDDHHHVFRLRPAKDTRGPRPPKRTLWESGELITLVYPKVHRDRIQYLPGVSELYPDGVPEPEQEPLQLEIANEDDREVSWVDRVANTARRQVGGEILKRERPVGRFQRMVSWASVGGTLLVPNWPYVRAYVVVNRS